MPTRILAQQFNTIRSIDYIGSKTCVTLLVRPKGLLVEKKRKQNESKGRPLFRLSA